MSSLIRNSLARLLADGSGLVCGMIAGIITARWLGPAGKGVFSTLTFLSGLLMQFCCVGLQEASTVMVGQKKATIQEALSATVPTISISALIGIIGLWLICAVQFKSDWSSVRFAVITACLSLPVAIFSNVLSGILISQNKVIHTSIILFITSGLTTLGLWLFIAILPLTVLGGVLAGLLSSTVGLIVIIALLIKGGLSLSPRWNLRYITPALRFGAVIQISYLLIMMSARVDLLLVYSMIGQAAAGYYSVALTLGMLVGLAPSALSIASFPRLAYLGNMEAHLLTIRICRIGLAAAALSGIAMLIAIPVMVPFLFGQIYYQAIEPSLILVLGGVIWSVQWLLCRASAAQGNPGLVFYSFGVSLLVMLLFDYALIPLLGIVGAAIAAMIGPAIGLAVCLILYCRKAGHALRLAEFLPCVNDFRFLAASVMRAVSNEKSRPVVSSPELNA